MSDHGLPLVILPSEAPHESLLLDSEPNRLIYWVVDVATDQCVGYVGSFISNEWHYRLSNNEQPCFIVYSSLSDAVTALLDYVVMGTEDE